MLGKLFLANSIMYAELMELVEDNYNRWMDSCSHSSRDIEPCGCWDCDDCDKMKKCVPCSMQEN